MYRLLMLVPAVLSGSALAHPGEHHDGLFSTLLHLLSEPDHLVMLIAAIVVGVVGARRVFRSHDSR